MTLNSSKETVRQSSDAKTRSYFSSFPMDSTLETAEQIRRFELLRLAFFVLKLRKIEQRALLAQPDVGAQFIASTQAETKAQDTDLPFRCNLLRHVIFQQVLTLIQLDSRDQAMQIIDTCNKS